MVPLLIFGGAILAWLVFSGKAKTMTPNQWLALVIALVGPGLPNAASYQATICLPAGAIAIMLSAVPMFAFPIALLMAYDRFSFCAAPSSKRR